jgi:hypothetical protein
MQRSSTPGVGWNERFLHHGGRMELTFPAPRGSDGVDVFLHPGGRIGWRIVTRELIGAHTLRHSAALKSPREGPLLLARVKHCAIGHLLRVEVTGLSGKHIKRTGVGQRQRDH